MPLSIRLATPGDAPGLATVIVDTWLATHRGQIPEGQWQKRHDEWTYNVSDRGWQRTLQAIQAGTNTQTCVYVAVTDEDKVVGLAVGGPARLELLSNAAEVSVIYIRPAYQGQGLGRRLIQRVAAHQAALGRRALLISVLATNVPARRFYEALGGQLVGTHETVDYGYKESQVVYGWEDSRVVAVRR